MSSQKAIANRIMWWPVNQECTNCRSNKRLSLADLQAQGMYADLKKDRKGNYIVPKEEEYLAYHATQCMRNIVLGNFGNHQYECSSKQVYPPEPPDRGLLLRTKISTISTICSKYVRLLVSKATF